MLTFSMGLRQSLGIFLQPLTHDVGISVSEFTLAIAVQNLAWGFLQPFAGALTVRYGFRPIMMIGAALYVAGLVLMASAHGLPSVVLGAGLLIGMSLACTAAAIAMSVAARAVPATRAQHGARHHLGGGLAGCAIVRADRAGAEPGLWVANGIDRLCGIVALNGAGGLVRRARRQDTAAKTVFRPDRQRLGG